MAKYEYDATQEKWLHGDPGVLSGSVAAAGQRYAKSTQVRENCVPQLSLIDWLICGPMMVGLGFLIGVYWP
jgi:hypothetical protein